jgi:hypothetical protein
VYQELDFIPEDRKQCPKCYHETMIITRAWPSISNPGVMFIKWECKARIKGFLCPGKKFEQLPMAAAECPVPKPKPAMGHATKLGDCLRCGDKAQALQTWGDAGQICLRCTAELVQLGYDPAKAPMKYNTQPVLQCELCAAMVKVLHLAAGGLVCTACNEVCEEGAAALESIIP